MSWEWIVLGAAAAASALEPDCLCGHAHGWHVPRSIVTGELACRKRLGWRRRRCLCGRYEPAAL